MCFFFKKSFAETNSRVVHLSGSQCKFLPLRKPEMLTLESRFPTAKRKAHFLILTSEDKLQDLIKVNEDDQKSVRPLLFSPKSRSSLARLNFAIVLMTESLEQTTNNWYLGSRLAFLLTVIPPHTDQQPLVHSRRKDVKTQRRSYKDDNHNLTRFLNLIGYQ